MSEHQPTFQQESTLSDKYEDQYDRLNKAVSQQMQVLFQFNNLLNNEYLIRKFQVDPFYPNQLVLAYEVVQRENSIKHQYVQNEQNTRKQYHLILTDILKKHNGKLWNYDDQYLLIRPYFPKERKQLYIKVHRDNKDNILAFVKDELKDLQYQVTEAPYQPDPKFIKVNVTASDEKTASELFQKVRKLEYINSVIMEDIDFLHQFQTQLQEKKMKQYMENNLKRQEQFQQQQDGSYKSRDRGNYKPYNKPYHGGGGAPRHQYNDNKHSNWTERQDRPVQSHQQTPVQSVQTPVQVQPSSPSVEQQSSQYTLVRKNSSAKTPGQTFKTPRSHPKEYPALDELKNQSVA